MKKRAFTLAALIFLGLIIGSAVFFNMLNLNAKQMAFAYNKDSRNSNVQMKLLSRGDAMDRIEQDKKLKLMTYNIHRGIGKDRKLDLNAVAEVISAGDAGIVALQEVERHSIRTLFQDQIKLLSEKTNMNYAFGKNMNILNGEYGNGLLSKYPIEEYQTYDLPSMGEQRTVLRAVISVDGYRMAVYNTHLGLNKQERQQQLEYIVKLVLGDELDYILMGDLNSRIDELKQLLDFMKDSSEGSEKQLQSTFEEDAVSERIDYIFVGADTMITNYDVVLSEASDHYPVICELVVGK